VIYTNDADFLALAAQGIDHAGVVYNATGKRSVQQIVELLVLINECISELQMYRRIEFL